MGFFFFLFIQTRNLWVVAVLQNLLEMSAGSDYGGGASACLQVRNLIVTSILTPWPLSENSNVLRREPAEDNPPPPLKNICSTVIAFVLHVEGMKQGGHWWREGGCGIHAMFCRTQGGADANGALVQLSWEGLGIHICHEGVSLVALK